MSDNAATADNRLIEAAKGAFRHAFGGVVVLEPLGDNAVWVDGRQSPVNVTRTAPADVGASGRCTWRGGAETLTRAITGGQPAATALISGRLSIAGDMSVMMRIKLGNDTGG